jgi:glycosyltransferase involved in cell wall biosynthesis
LGISSFGLCFVFGTGWKPVLRSAKKEDRVKILYVTGHRDDPDEAVPRSRWGGARCEWTICTPAGDGDGRRGSFWWRMGSLLRQREFDLICVDSPRLGLPLLVVLRCTRPDLLDRTMMVLDADHAGGHPCRRWMWLAVLLPVFAWFTRIVCRGHASWSSVPRRYRAWAGERLVTIPPGADLGSVDEFRQPAPGLAERDVEPLRLITAGRLDSRGNHQSVVRALAAAQSADVRLTVVGDGPLRSSLRKLARRLNVAQRVLFTGSLSRAETLRHLWESDGYVSMSQNGDAGDVLEAMSCHCPAVLSDIPPHREIQADRPDLIPLIGCRDWQSLADAIDTWCRLPGDVRRSWGADCRHHVEEHFPPSRQDAQWDQVLADFDPEVNPEWAVFCRCLRRLSGGRR